MSRIRKAFSQAIAMLFVLTAPAWAGELKITSESGEVLATYTQTSIEKMEMREIKTETPWTDGIVSFEGVSLGEVLADAGVEGRDVTGLAVDDYAASIPADVIKKHDPIIATRMNGELMVAGNKGPFWIIFDFDDLSADDAFEARTFAVWHLNEIEVE